MKRVRSMRDIIAEAIRGEPTNLDTPWPDLSADRRAPWLEDATRVMTALRNEMWWHFAEHAFEDGGVEWIANDPGDLWKDFFDICLRTDGPHPLTKAA